jgi:hypothetical protein
MANIATLPDSGRIQLLGNDLTALASTSFIPADIIANKNIGPGCLSLGQCVHLNIILQLLKKYECTFEFKDEEYA